jgi:hypothetical protein
LFRVRHADFSARGEDEMKGYTIAAVVLIVAGVIALVYGRFSYTKKTEAAKLGPIEVTVNEKKSVNIPDWAGAASIIAGAGMLALPLFKR